MSDSWCGKNYEKEPIVTKTRSENKSKMKKRHAQMRRFSNDLSAKSSVLK